ncbi:hypothetical protein QYF36_023385 [Acer negundo]|nr:hypothetical protein QYF36_023385 [Acer negundo]
MGRSDEVVGEVGGENRHPLEEVNRRQLQEEKLMVGARREIDSRWRRWIAGCRRCISVASQEAMQGDRLMRSRRIFWTMTVVQSPWCDFRDEATKADCFGANFKTLFSFIIPMAPYTMKLI